MIKKNSIAFRIITRVLLITITLFVVILSVYYFYTRNLIHQTTRSNAILQAENLVGKIEQELKPLEKIPQMVSATLELGLFCEDSLMTILEAIVYNNKNVYGASIAFEPNSYPEIGTYYMPYAYRAGDQIKTTYLGGIDYEYFYMDWYQIPKMINSPYWSEPYFDEGGGNILMATYSMPFYKRTKQGRQFAGVTTVDISLEKLSDFVSKVKILETGYAFMLSGNGVAVTHPDKTQIMNKSIFSNAEDWNAPVLREVGRDLMQGNSNFRDYNIPGKDERWIYYTKLKSSNWSIAVVYPDKEMYASLKQMNIILIILILAGLLLLTLLTVNIINRIAAPITLFAHSAYLIAKGNFNVNLPPVKSKDEMLELHEAFINMQKQLSDYIENLKETTSAKEKIESELRIAREIQMGMIPKIFPPFPDLPEIDLYAILEPAKEVGGDLYDFFLIDNKHLCFAIGDVSGKGVPASLFMAVTRTLLRSVAPKQHSTKDIVNILNKSLSSGNESSMFVTFFLGIINIDTGKLKYTNAGHNPPVMIRENGQVEMFEVTHDIPIGLFEDFDYTEKEIKVSKNDRLFMYTDGVTEAENCCEELYSDMRLLDCLSGLTDTQPKDMVLGVAKDVAAHVKENQQSDDMTMLSIIYFGK